MLWKVGCFLCCPLNNELELTIGHPTTQRLKGRSVCPTSLSIYINIFNKILLLLLLSFPFFSLIKSLRLAVLLKMWTPKRTLPYTQYLKALRLST
jgi:hypothetical protein